MSFTPTTKINACPICDEVNTGCGLGKNPTHWQCAIIDGRKGQTFRKYICLGTTRDKKYSRWQVIGGEA